MFPSSDSNLSLLSALCNPSIVLTRNLPIVILEDFAVYDWIDKLTVYSKFSILNIPK